MGAGTIPADGLWINGFRRLSSRPTLMIESGHKAKLRMTTFVITDKFPPTAECPDGFRIAHPKVP